MRLLPGHASPAPEFPYEACLHSLRPAYACLSLILAATALQAQLPPGWSRQPSLGEGRQGAWYGAGVWAGDKHSVPATFVDSLGLGNALTGSGTHLEAGWRGSRLDVAGQVNAWREVDGTSRLILQRFHLAYTSRGGWRTALEQEPLVWGYGLNGGYTLGEASRPFPRLSLESPFHHLQAFGVPLGTWKGQIFLGQVEGHKVLGEASQDPSARSRAIAANGDPQRPFLSGLRFEAVFAEDTELYLNYINLFGGSLLGRSLTADYQPKHWVASFFGLKDAYAEGGLGIDGASMLSTGRVKSASSSDVGLRIRFRILEPLLNAQDVRVYVSRGAKAVNTRTQVLLHQPLEAIGQDIERDWKSLVHTPLAPWTQRNRYALPTTPVPNDAVGLLVTWNRLRFGLEYLDTANSVLNPDNPGYPNHRTFEHSVYASGFYLEGDPLGNATGGEARTYTVRLEADWAPAWSTRTWLLWGDRPFRDDPDAWRLDHPGASPVRNHFLELQQVVVWRPDRVLCVQAGASTQHQSAYLNEPTRGRTGFRWFIDVGWTWPGR